VEGAAEGASGGSDIDFDDIFGVDQTSLASSGAAATDDDASAALSPKGGGSILGLTSVEGEIPVLGGASVSADAIARSDSIDRMFDVDSGDGVPISPLAAALDAPPLGGGGELGGYANGGSGEGDEGAEGDDDFLSWLGASETPEGGSPPLPAPSGRGGESPVFPLDDSGEEGADGGASRGGFGDIPFLQGASATAENAVAYRRAVRAYESTDATALRLKAALLSAGAEGGGGGRGAGGASAGGASAEGARDVLLRQVLDLCIASGSLPDGLRSAIYLHLLQIEEGDWKTDLEAISHAQVSVLLPLHCTRIMLTV
jgi:hypothetical protein